MPVSRQHADFAINFFEKVLKHTADEYYGKPFILAPWQIEAIEQIFGNVDEAGNRVIEQVYLEVPKKTGKTELVAGILLLVLIQACLLKHKGFQAYGAAAATRQALNVYRAACKMVEQAPLLKKHLRILRGTNRIIARGDVDTFYAAIAADGDMGDGVNPGCTAADEVHRWKTRKQLENWDVLSNGGITRRQTLTIAITTAGVQDESPLAYRLHEKTRRIQEGIVSDPRFYGRIYGADKTDDPADPKTWIKAIPSLKENGGFLDIQKIKDKYDSSVAEGDLSSFKRYFLNIWDQKENRAIDMTRWDACPAAWVHRGLGEALPEDKVRPLSGDILRNFIDRPCWAGVDLSLTTDLSALSFVFPPSNGVGRWDILPFFWKPKHDLKKHQIRDGVPYLDWAQNGFLEVQGDTNIDYSAIKERILWGSRVFDLREVCFDPWNSSEMMIDLDVRHAITCVKVDQRYNLSEPTKKLLKLVLAGEVCHGKHPVLRWNASCLSLKGDDNDNVRPAKPQRDKDRTRIDGISASVTAMFRAISFVSVKPKLEVFVF